MLDPEVLGERRSDRPAGDARAAPVARPDPPVGLGERIVAWWRWFGPARLVATVVSVVVVGLLGFWLVRSPVPAAEATLPVAGATSLPTVTLPPPTTTAGDPHSMTSAPSEEATTADVTIVVHVAGAIARPGVYELTGGARVDDAIGAAGGPSADADLDAVNLAQVLADGQRLFVPVVGSVDHAETPVLSPSGGSGVGTSGPVDDGSPSRSDPVDLNRAGTDELEQLPGVGPATASAIVDDRERNGPFLTVDELERVPGVGPAKLAALRDLVTL